MSPSTSTEPPERVHPAPERDGRVVVTQQENVAVLLYGLNSSLSTALMRALQPGVPAPRRRSTLRSATEALSVLQSTPVDVIFCDARPGKALPLLRALKRRGLDVPVVVVSEECEFDHWTTAMEAGATDFLYAPFEHAQLRWMFASYVHRRQPAA